MNDVSTYQSLTDVLLERKGSEHGITFIRGQNEYETISFGDMLARARQRLALFQSLGLQAGTQLIIQTNDLPAFIEAFWACLLGGIVAVPVSGGNSTEHRNKLFRIANTLDDPGLFTDQQNLTRIKKFASDHDRTVEFAALEKRCALAGVLDTALTEARIHKPSPDDTAFIQFSSGSTSTPKGIVLSHHNLLLNTEAIIDGCQMSGDDHLLSWMPLTHDMGLIGFHLTPLVCNTSHSLLPTDVFVRRPALWLQEASRLRATILCSPNFGYQHLLKSFKVDAYSQLDLSCVQYLFNGAEPISVSLCREFMQAMKPFGLRLDAMYPVYGLAEASLAVTFPPRDNRFTTMTVDRASLSPGQTIKPVTADEGVTFVSVGLPVKHVQIQICDENGDACEDDVTGRICIRGGNVTRGYYKEPALNQELISDDGWLDTGDLGYLHNQQLYITGRAKDIIFVSGQNVYPHDLEELVFAENILERGKLAIASLPSEDLREEHLIAFVQHRGESEALQETGKTIAGILANASGVSLHAVVPVARIPKTTSGKVQRYLLVAQLQQGQHQILPLGAQSVPIEEEVEAPASDSLTTAEQLLALCNKQIEEGQVNLNDNLFELGISSLTLSQIHAAIEEQWPDQVDITDLFDYPSVGELATFLDTKIS